MSGEPQPLRISATRAFVAAKHGLAYRATVALPGTDTRVRHGSRTIQRWASEGGSPAVGRGGDVATLEELAAFVLHKPNRVKRVRLFFKQQWNAGLFNAVGHEGGDPLTDAQRLELTPKAERGWDVVPAGCSYCRRYTNDIDVELRHGVAPTVRSGPSLPVL
jgi:hypothetical protein